MKKTVVNIHLGAEEALQLLGLSREEETPVAVELRTAVVREVAKLLVHKMLPQDVRSVVEEIVKREVQAVVGEWRKVPSGWRDERRFEFTDREMLDSIERTKERARIQLVDDVSAQVRETLAGERDEVREWARRTARKLMEEEMKGAVQQALVDEARSHVSAQLARLAGEDA